MTEIPALLWIALALAGLVSLFLAWRLTALQRALRRLERTVHSNPQSLAAVPQLASLSRAVRLAIEANQGQLASLTAERDRLATVLDQMTDGVLIADAHGAVQYANPAAAETLAAPETVGRSITEVLRDHRLVETWERSRTLGVLQSESVEMPTRQRYLQLIVIPDRHAGGTLLLVQDLTRLRRLETVRRDFVSNISHELRTPLASLRALAESLLGGAAADPVAGPRFLERIVKEVDALTGISEELLELTAIESGQAELRFERCGACELLESAADRMRVHAERAGLHLRVECPDGLPDLRVDRGRLEQVLVSLIHNAVKFTPQGGEIVLSARVHEGEQREPEPGAVEISVRDTGEGIPEDDLPRIFERFYRADKARSRGGTGLGLSIARHIVEAHGGEVWAESIQGKGSTFRLSVPCHSGPGRL